VHAQRGEQAATLGFRGNLFESRLRDLRLEFGLSGMNDV
jgi:hypothetical protein